MYSSTRRRSLFRTSARNDGSEGREAQPRCDSRAVWTAEGTWWRRAFRADAPCNTGPMAAGRQPSGYSLQSFPKLRMAPQSGQVQVIPLQLIPPQILIHARGAHHETAGATPTESMLLSARRTNVMKRLLPPPRFNRAIRRTAAHGPPSPWFQKHKARHLPTKPTGFRFAAPANVDIRAGIPDSGQPALPAGRRAADRFLKQVNCNLKRGSRPGSRDKSHSSARDR